MTILPVETPELELKVELGDELELRRSPIMLLSGTLTASISSFFFDAGMTI